MDGIELSSEYGEIWDYKYDKSEAKQKINAEWDELCSGFKRGYGEHFTPRELCVLDVSGKRFVLGNGFCGLGQLNEFAYRRAVHT
jgi:hypothetical protein